VAFGAALGFLGGAQMSKVPPDEGPRSKEKAVASSTRSSRLPADDTAD
jgi:hypothetical protein